MAYLTIDSNQVTRRRDRIRDATLAEIKRLAWDQIAESGAGSLSLRAIARDMGMTSSALYRYFESRDQLIDALCLDSFASLADALEQAERGSSKNGRKSAAPPAGDFLKVVRAYRRWALEHPTEYTLVFGAGVRTFGPEAKEEMERGVAVLFRAMKRGLEVGQVRPAPLAPTAGRKLRSKLSRWANDMGGELPPEALAACMFVWTQLHGAISLELFGHIPEQLMPADDLFDHLMHEVLRQLGCPVEAGGSRGPR